MRVGSHSFSLLRLLLRRRRRAAHDIPDEVRVQAFFRPEGRASVSSSRASRLRPCATSTSRGEATASSTSPASTPRSAKRRPSGSATRSSCTKTTCGSAVRGSRTSGSRSSPIAPLPPTSRRSRTSLRRACGTTPTFSGARACSTSCWSTRSSRSGPSSRSGRAWSGSASGSTPSFASSRRRARSAPSTCTATRARAARPALVSGGVHASCGPASCTSWRGPDHLLFILLLVVPFRRFLPLAAIVTAFTVAHSITLIATALGLGPDALWFPPLIETLIAASILYMAIENVLGARTAPALDPRVCVRAGARVRLRLRPAAAHAVRRRPPGDLAPRL